MSCPKCKLKVDYSSKTYWPKRFLGYCKPCGEFSYLDEMKTPYRKTKNVTN